VIITLQGEKAFAELPTSKMKDGCIGLLINSGDMSALQRKAEEILKEKNCEGGDIYEN